MNTVYNTTENNSTHFCVAIERSSVTDTVTHFRLQKFLLPILLVTLITECFHLVLRPLGQVIFVSQMMAGIILGPSVIGKKYKKLSAQMFSPFIVTVLNFFDRFGMVYLTFSICARMDVNIIKKSGRLAIILGIGSCVIPILSTTLVAYSVKDNLQMDEHQRLIYHIVGTLEGLVNFPVIATLLTDLKILNSELGRLTLSTSLINGTLGMILNGFFANHIIDANAFLKFTTWIKHLSVIVMIAFAVYALRPLIKWMMMQTLEGKPLRHAHIMVIHLMILSYAMCGEVIGYHALLGSIILGLATPVSPPMGSRFAETIEYFAWAVFMPCFIIDAGRKMDLYTIERHQVFAVELMVLVAMVTRILTIMLPSLYYKIPLKDAISLTLLLNTRGIYDVHHFRFFHENKLITDQSFAIMALTSMLKSALFIPTVRHIYDSSRRYVAYRRRTLQHSKNQDELRILACIHEPDDVATIINILQASNHPGSPIGVYVMKLEEYVGSFIPLIIPHRLDQEPSNRNTTVNQMVKAFCHYEEENKDHVFVHCYTAIAPNATMQDDICLMAFEKNTSLVIIPFQKSNRNAKIVIKNVLNLAPCSVGIFYDRGTFMNPKPILSRYSPLKVCIIFIGGPDDREALAYGLRMAKNYKIFFKVIQLTDKNQTNSDTLEDKQDLYMINDLRASIVDSRNIKYLEKRVEEGSDTIWILNSLGDDFDLILVGRNHNSESNVLSGLNEWNETEEFGLVGDILVSSDFRGIASVMVIQQQASVVGGMIGGPKYSMK